MKRLLLLFSLIICLTGCVNYDVGINFPQANQGTITQQIKLSEQLSNVSEKEGHAWLKSLEKKASTLQGKSEYLSSDEILLTIPFSNGQELVNKFNQFFLPFNNETTTNYLSRDENLNLLDLSANLSINQNNAILIERNTLKLTTDLTSLGVTSGDGNMIFSSGDLINLQVKLNFPWGAKIITNEFAQWEKLPHHQYNIQLQAGQINEITAIFWIPNYVGLGTIVILVVIIFGFYAKYRRLPLIDN